ncbi:MAG: molybdopterin-dependent oxidoreductase [Pseudonocardiaceae bacterium]
MLVAAFNPVVTAPNASHVAERLDALDFLVVTDFFLSETAQRADVVLPTTQWAEEDGTMTNPEGRGCCAAEPSTRRRACAATWRSCENSPTGWAADSSSRPTHARSTPSYAGPARAAQPTTPGSPMTGSPRARSCSGHVQRRRTPGRRGCSSSPFPPPTAGPGSSR